jgi:response regulator RpfG family c-di-GMP phosphodiesterase
MAITNSLPAKKGKILIIDNDEKHNQLVVSTLSKVYEVKVAKSTEEAKSIINEDFDPGVIFCLDELYKTKNNLMLSLCEEKCPDTVKIVLTLETEPQKIIAAINRCKAFMYLAKPCNKLELFQAALVGIDRYFSSLRTKKFRETSMTKIKNLNKKLSEANRIHQSITSKLVDINKRHDELSKEHKKLSKDLEQTNSEYKELNEKLNIVNEENAELNESLAIANKENKTLSNKNEELLNLVASLEVFPNQSLQSLSVMINEYQKFYYTDHTEYVTSICLAIAEDMKLSHNSIKLLQLSALIHNIVLINMPEQLQIIDPYEMEEPERRKYFRYFIKSIDNLKKIDFLKKAAEVIYQMWEHYDGSGYPKALKGDNIMIEAQVLSIACIYHNRVYRVYPEDIPTLKIEGKVKQTKHFTLNRHKSIVKELYKMAKFFEYEVLHTFQEIVKHKECEYLIPVNEDLEIDLADFYTDVENISDAELLEQELHPFQARVGMIATHPIITVNGKEVIPANTKLDPEHVKKIKQMFNSNLIGATILLKAPSYF